MPYMNSVKYNIRNGKIARIIKELRVLYPWKQKEDPEACNKSQQADVYNILLN